MLASIRTFFISILIFFLSLPYGFDEPTRAYIKDCSLINNTAVCEQTENGAEATFTLRMRHDNRPIWSDHALDNFKIKVFVSDASLDLNKGIDNSIFEWPFVVIGDDETYPPVEVQGSVAFENQPEFIRAGDEYTVIVHLTFPAYTTPGTYSVAVSPNYAQECIFLNALIIC